MSIGDLLALAALLLVIAALVQSAGRQLLAYAVAALALAHLLPL